MNLNIEVKQFGPCENNAGVAKWLEVTSEGVGLVNRRSRVRIPSSA